AALRAADGPRVLGVGEMLVRSGRRARSLPVDVARTIEEALTATPLDFVHVHEPFAPSAASAALRHSRSLNVGSFHAPTERMLSTQLGRRMVELFFGRLDARVASYEATRDLIGRFFPGDYRVVRPGAATGHRADRPGGPPVIAFVADEERGALRLFLRALRRLPLDREWRALVWSPRSPIAAPVMRREVRERLELAGPGEMDDGKRLSGAD